MIETESERRARVSAEIRDKYRADLRAGQYDLRYPLGPLVALRDAKGEVVWVGHAESGEEAVSLYRSDPGRVYGECYDLLWEAMQAEGWTLKEERLA